MPYLFATCSACSWRRLTTEVTVTPSMFARPSRCLMPKAPVPASAIFISVSPTLLCSALLLGGLGGPQHEVPDGGVGTWHMVEAVKRLGLRAERAAHDQPHDKLNALRARLAHEFQVLHLCKTDRVLHETVHERAVERRVDETGPRALQLVAHAAGAPDVHVEVRV